MSRVACGTASLFTPLTGSAAANCSRKDVVALLLVLFAVELTLTSGCGGLGVSTAWNRHLQSKSGFGSAGSAAMDSETWRKAVSSSVVSKATVCCGSVSHQRAAATAAWRPAACSSSMTYSSNSECDETVTARIPINVQMTRSSHMLECKIRLLRQEEPPGSRL